MDTKELLQPDWEDNLNAHYADIHIDRTLQKQRQEEKYVVKCILGLFNTSIKAYYCIFRAILAARNTREAEISYNDRFMRLKDEFIIDLSIDDEEQDNVNDYPQLTEEHRQKIMHWMYGRDPYAELIQKFNLTIKRIDIQTLNWNPIQWLNDEVINFYMELLSERSRENKKLPKVHSMNTFFLKRLMESNYSAVRRWTRKVDIFSFDIIPIPVHKGCHWCMAIIHFKNKTITYYDSMGSPDDSVLMALEGYLQDEFRDKKKSEFDMCDWKKVNAKNIPQQENGSDCGVFSCMFAEFITRKRPLTFTQQNMEYFRMRMVYEICTGKLLIDS